MANVISEEKVSATAGRVMFLSAYGDKILDWITKFNKINGRGEVQRDTLKFHAQSNGRISGQISVTRDFSTHVKTDVLLFTVNRAGLLQTRLPNRKGRKVHIDSLIEDMKAMGEEQ